MAACTLCELPAATVVDLASRLVAPEHVCDGMTVDSIRALLRAEGLVGGPVQVVVVNAVRRRLPVSVVVFVRNVRLSVAPAVIVNSALCACLQTALRDLAEKRALEAVAEVSRRAGEVHVRCAKRGFAHVARWMSTACACVRALRARMGERCSRVCVWTARATRSGYPALGFVVRLFTMVCACGCASMLWCRRKPRELSPRLRRLAWALRCVLFLAQASESVQCPGADPTPIPPRHTLLHMNCSYTDTDADTDTHERVHAHPRRGTRTVLRRPHARSHCGRPCHYKSRSPGLACVCGVCTLLQAEVEATRKAAEAEAARKAAEAEAARKAAEEAARKAAEAEATRKAAEAEAARKAAEEAARKAALEAARKPAETKAVESMVSVAGVPQRSPSLSRSRLRALTRGRARKAALARVWCALVGCWLVLVGTRLCFPPWGCALGGPQHICGHVELPLRPAPWLAAPCPWWFSAVQCAARV